MEQVKQLCRDMAANPHIMTFTDIADAAAKGVIMGNKLHNPLLGAVLGVTLEAGTRAVEMTKELIRDVAGDVDERNAENVEIKPQKPKAKSKIKS